MHGHGPQLFILAKKAALGDEHPDYSGAGFIHAKKSAAEKPDDQPDEPDDQPDTPPDAGTEAIGQELRSMSARLCEIAAEMGAPKDEGDSESHGAKQVLA
jgi:hypothetical protein